MKRIILGVFSVIILVFSCKKEDNLTPTSSSIDISSKVLLWLDASNPSSLSLDGQEVNSWNSEVGNKVAISDGNKMLFNEATSEVIASFDGSLGVSNLEDNVFGFLLVGRIVDASSYSVILGYSPMDDGVTDRRFLVRAHSTERYDVSPQGIYNNGNTFVNPDSENIPGNTNTHLFYAQVDSNDVSSSFYIGSKGNGQGGKYAYSEVIVLKEELTEEELNHTITSLIEKWNIQ